jgi:hypothetical protein
VAKDADQADEERRYQDGDGYGTAEPFHALYQRRLTAGLSQHVLRQLADARSNARCDNKALTAPPSDDRSRIGHVPAISKGRGYIPTPSGILEDRKRLASQ